MNSLTIHQMICGLLHFKYMFPNILMYLWLPLHKHHINHISRFTTDVSHAKLYAREQTIAQSMPLVSFLHKFALNVSFNTW